MMITENLKKSIRVKASRPLVFVLKYICLHPSSINLMKKRRKQQQFPIFFTSSLFISVAKTLSFNILKTISLKIKKKTSTEAQSEGRALVDKTSGSHLAD